MKDLRLIALCNVLYKVLANVMANRLKGLLARVISPMQSTFVPGRLMTDNILVAFEEQGKGSCGRACFEDRY